MGSGTWAPEHLAAMGPLLLSWALILSTIPCLISRPSLGPTPPVHQVHVAQELCVRTRGSDKCYAPAPLGKLETPWLRAAPLTPPKTFEWCWWSRRCWRILVWISRSELVWLWRISVQLWFWREFQLWWGVLKFWRGVLQQTL